jgi:hypothetical protein
VIRSRWLWAAAALLGVVLAVRLLGGTGGGHDNTAPTPEPAATAPAWYPPAAAFLQAWSAGNYREAAWHATPALGAALARADSHRAPGGPAALNPLPLTEGPTWVEALADAGSLPLVLSVSWDGERWLVADIETRLP